jgi:hypothetical protein
VSSLLIVFSEKSIPILEGVAMKKEDKQFILFFHSCIRIFFELVYVIVYLLLVLTYLLTYLVHVRISFDNAFQLNGDDLEDDSQALDDDSEDLLVGRFLNVFRTVFFNFIFLLA